MIISNIDYHLILLTYLEEHFNKTIKERLAIIIPDVILEFKGSVKKLKIEPGRIYIHMTAGPKYSPDEIVDSLKALTSQRLIHVREELRGFEKIFTDDYFIKSGSKPTKAQVSDFVSIAASGI